MSNTTILSSIRYKWTAACTGNTCVDSDNGTALNWRGITVAELIVGPKGVIFTPLYKFNGEINLSIHKFPEANPDFDKLIADIHTLEKLCNLYDEVVPMPGSNEVRLKTRGQVFASIGFHGTKVIYSAITRDGSKTTDSPETIMKFSEYIRTSSRNVDLKDDSDIINSLGKNIGPKI